MDVCILICMVDGVVGGWMRKQMDRWFKEDGWMEGQIDRWVV